MDTLRHLSGVEGFDRKSTLPRNTPFVGRVVDRLVIHKGLRCRLELV